MTNLSSVSNETEVIKSCLVTGFPYTYINMPNGPLEIFERFIRKEFRYDDWVLLQLIFAG